MKREPANINGVTGPSKANPAPVILVCEVEPCQVERFFSDETKFDLTDYPIRVPSDVEGG
jgi:hypothetical protein